MSSLNNKTSLPLQKCPGKTPIQILHEYGTKTSNLPVFVLEKAEGEAHQRSFVYSVTIGDFTGTGHGPSKKAAKHRAAKAALNSLQMETGQPLHIPGTESNCVSMETDDNTRNPVGLLQEMALQRGWRMPEYALCGEAGPPHKREFTVTCRLESLSETAAGGSKKGAKKAAAAKIVAKLQNMPGCPEMARSPKPSISLDNLRSSAAEKISLLRRRTLSIPNRDYVQLLLELATEQGFQVTYFDIDELTVIGQYQCLAELSTTPVTVCHGTGISCSIAHNTAAHSALQYIKIMASK